MLVELYIFFELLTIVLFFFLGNGCRFIFKKPEREKVSLVQVSGKSLPVFTDDLEGSGLNEAISLQIEKLKKGDLVKLMFEGNKYTERMWVIITSRKNSKFTGEINNHPVNPDIHVGDPVEFSSKHIATTE